MKATIFLFLSLCFTMNLQAQVTKTANVTAGELQTIFTAEELSTITNLTLTGTIDARDFKTMRDDMTALAILDLSNVTVASYTGAEGTGGEYETDYPANEIPFAAFVNVITENGKTSLNSIMLPININSIGPGAFYNCSGLKSISIPRSVLSFGYVSFFGCSGLTSIIVNSSHPIDLNNSEEVFSGVNKNLCNLKVPFGAKELYAAASQWRDFTNIDEEESGIFVSIDNLKFSVSAGSEQVDIIANVSWTASSDQSWPKIEPTSGTGNQSLSITVEANQSELSRSAQITFSAIGHTSQILKVQQDGLNKTINVTAGKLLSALSVSELEGISNLKIAGTIDARDFKTMRDLMPYLSILDLTDANITEYNGAEGTSGNYFRNYYANTVPAYAFYDSDANKGKTSLTMVYLPKSVTSMEYLAFSNCSGLTSITIPAKLTTIGNGVFAYCSSLSLINIPASVSNIESGAFAHCGAELIVDAGNLNYSSLDGVLFDKNKTILFYCPISKTGSYKIPSSVKYLENIAFQGCINLTEIIIPSNVLSIGYETFDNCTGLISVEAGNLNYSGIEGLLFNKDATELIKCPVSKAGSFVIPSGVKSISTNAFNYCRLLTSVSIPVSVVQIGDNAFSNCSGLTTFTMASSYPVDLSSSYGVFSNVNQTTCSLNVPYGAKKFYAVADQWKDFANIVEQSKGFIVGSSFLKLDAENGSKDTVNILANVEWTINLNQSWLSVSPTSGTGNSNISITVEGNTSVSSRTAIMAVLATGFEDQTITITQSGLPKTINNTAGNILSNLSKTELSQISNLTITGTMDARDFRILRDSMPFLEDLDLSGVTVEAYSGLNGTDYPYYSTDYPANAIPQYAFYNNYTYPPKSNLTSVILPESITSIEAQAFYYCKKLTSITIPQSVVSIGNSAFNYCTGLTSIKVESSYPVDLSSNYSVFSGIDKNRCTLNVPFSSKNLYSSADQWKDFKNIVEETQGFLLSSKVLKLAADEGSSATASITSNVDWTDSSDQAWLTVDPVSGSGDKTLYFSALANATFITRTAKVTFSASQVTSQYLTIYQEGIPKTIKTEAGGLLTGLTTDELNGITNLTITGSIDARDFKTMRDKMPLLSALNLSGANIVAYSGMEGTSYQTEYPGNTIPEYAFYNQNTGNGKNSLISVVLPATLKEIGNSSFLNCSGLNLIEIPSSVSELGSYAFSGCSSLTSFNLPSSLNIIQVGVFKNCKSLTNVSIPSSVVLIGNEAFSGCIALSSVTLPSSLVYIWDYAFNGCSSLTSINLPNSLKFIGGSAFSGCSSLTSIAIPSLVTSIANSTFQLCLGLTSVSIPASVTSIGEGAFAYCRSLTSITIPASMTSIGSSAFQYCSGLTSITANSSHPVNLSNSPNVFYGINKNSCTLNVPYKAKTLYSSAVQWKDFINIVEETQGFLLDSTSINFTADGGSVVVNSTANVTWTANSNQSWLIVNPTSGTGTQAISFTAEANATAAVRKATVTVSSTNVLSQNINITQEGLPKTIDILAGGLISGLTTDELKGITNLTITGTIDARDFKTMRDYMPMLAVLDLSNAEIVAYSGPGGTTDYENVYPANEIPDYAFLNSNTYTGKTSLESVLLPESLNSIGILAFNGCTGLLTIEIPSTVSAIAQGAFMNCNGLTSIYAYSAIPVDLNDSWSVFSGIDYSNCILYVPYDSRNLYASAYQWQDFINITEDSLGFNVFPTLINLAAESGSIDTLIISANVFWTVSSDQAWLTVQPTSGEGNQTVTLTSEANNLPSSRKAIVTISAKDIPSQTIIVKQEASTAPVNVTAGNLKTLFTADELNSITTLKLSGTIDARDFKTMRDEMPNLIEIDLRGVTVKAYTGTQGTSWGTTNTAYPVNAIPINAFYNGDTGAGKTRLTTFIFPNSTNSIGANSFLYSSNLTSVIIPSSITRIGGSAFGGCFESESIIIPASVTDIESGAFQSCYFIIVDNNNPNFASIDGVLYSKDLTKLIQCPTSVSPEFKIRPTINSVMSWAFYGRWNLESVNIPSSVNFIGEYAFGYCFNLREIYLKLKIPIDLSNAQNVFQDVDKDKCVLYVPYGSKVLYEDADQWKDFANIVEYPFIVVPQDIVYIEASEGSNAEVLIESDVNWTASSNENWLTVTPASELNSQKLLFTANENPSRIYRKAQVSVIAEGVDPQIIYITQEGSNVPLEVTPDGLRTLLTAEELALVTKLTLTGTIDARDFKTMRDDMPNLAEIDLSGATVAAYTGTGGTAGSEIISYPANSIPDYAFWTQDTYIGKSSLIKFIFPENTSSIGQRAFQYSGLNSIILPLTITEVLDGAFYGSFGIDTIKISNSVTKIESFALFGIGYINIDEENSDYSSLDGVLYNKAQSLLIQFPSAKTGDFIIPSSVVKIEFAAFTSSNLISLTIPSSVISIGGYAFQACNNLTSIIVDSSLPIDLQESYNVFAYVDKNNCILKVPYGSKALYAAANQWQDFANIMEMPGFLLSDTLVSVDHHKGNTVEVEISSNTNWSLDWDQTWMEVNMISAKGNKTITIKVMEDNPEYMDRNAVVTVSASGVESQTIIVTQSGIPVGVNDIGINSNQFNCYPNPFTDMIKIEILNPERNEILLDIYNITGELVKNLVNKISDEKIEINWNGTDDSGRKVPQGIYICKMNNISKKLIFGGTSGD